MMTGCALRPSGSSQAMTHFPDDTDADETRGPEDEPEEPGADGGTTSPAADTPPGAPSNDDSELGDTDQHSDA
jgi:hypothetical protein